MIAMMISKGYIFHAFFLLPHPRLFQENWERRE